jgi:hypothetical protein
MTKAKCLPSTKIMKLKGLNMQMGVKQQTTRDKEKWIVVSMTILLSGGI